MVKIEAISALFRKSNDRTVKDELLQIMNTSQEATHDGFISLKAIIKGGE